MLYDELVSFLFTAEHGWAIRLILWLQSFRTPPITALASVFHFIGSEVFILPLVIFIYWSWDKHLGRRLLPILMLSSWLNATLKEALKRPRPFNVSQQVLDQTPPFARERSYGIPSGHTQNSTMAGGIAANELRRWWILVVTVLYAVLTGFSRMILGAHFPQDIILGFLLGMTVLGIYGVLEPPIGRWISTQSMALKIVAVILMTAIMTAIHPILLRPTKPLWILDEIPLDSLLARAMVPAGGFLGIGIGLILEDRYLYFDSKGTWPQRLFRIIIGMLGVALLYYALSPLSTVPRIPIAGDLVRFAVIGFWITFGAPWLFIRLNVASRTLKTDPYAEK
jgi:membrane-associated phospholipid phosphatase